MSQSSIKKSKRISLIISYILLIIFSAITILPFVWLIRSSFMEIRQIFVIPIEWIPNPFRWKNYTEAIKIAPFATYLKNTAIIVFFVITGTVTTSSLAAYSFSRLKWRGRNIMFYLLLSTMMLPYAVTIIPTFIMWKGLGAINSFLPLTVPAWFGGGAFNIFLLRQFFMTIPKELDEAALIDGANHLQIFWRILVPLLKPALAVVAIFTFMSAWNDFLGPVIYLTDSDKYTLALGLSQFKSNMSAQWNYLMSASTMVLMPVVVLFFVCQKYFVQGITLTGMKD